MNNDMCHTMMTQQFYEYDKYNDDDFFISDIQGNTVLYLKYCNFSQQ